MPAPSYHRTRKEAIVAFLMWLGAGIWVITVSFWLGRGLTPTFIGGIPSWVLWGVLVPWLTLFVIHSWYSLFYMKADDSRSPQESDPPVSPSGKPR